MRSRLDSGGCESASEVIREGLRALQEREQAAAGFWARVRNKVAIARRQVGQGRMQDGEQVMNQILSERREARPTPRTASKKPR